MFIYMYAYIRSIYVRISDRRQYCRFTPSPLPPSPTQPSSYTCLINYPVLVRLITAAWLKLRFRRSVRDEFVDRFRRDRPTIFRHATLPDHHPGITQIVGSVGQILVAKPDIVVCLALLFPPIFVLHGSKPL